jgi:hypothetical protein
MICGFPDPDGEHPRRCTLKRGHRGDHIIPFGPSVTLDVRQGTPEDAFLLLRDGTFAIWCDEGEAEAL